MNIYSLGGILRATPLDNGQGGNAEQMIAPHDVAVNRRGDIYIGEVSATAGPWFPRKDKSRLFRTAPKLSKAARREEVRAPAYR